MTAMSTDDDNDTLKDVDLKKEDDVEDYHDTPTLPSSSYYSESKKKPSKLLSSPSLAPRMEQAREILNLDQHLMPMVGIFVSSVILLIAVTSKGGPKNDGGYLAYGIILSVVAMICSIMAIGLYQRPEFTLIQQNPKFPEHMNLFLFGWNFLGACIMTFGNGPFVITGNGYFASWSMVGFALYGMGLPSEESLYKNTNMGSIVIGHLAASMVVITALASSRDVSFQQFKGESTFGMIMACASVAFTAYRAKKSAHGGEDHGRNKDITTKETNGSDSSSAAACALHHTMVTLLTIMWTIAASLMTFRGPFLQTSNGYFGAWGAAITAVFIAMEEIKHGA